MALLSLGDRLCYELEEIVCHAPSAKERCHAQALLWLAGGAGVEEVAELLHVSRQTVYNWASRFQERDDLGVRARLLDAPQPGSPAVSRRPHRSTDRLGDRRRPPGARLSLDHLDCPAPAMRPAGFS